MRRARRISISNNWISQRGVRRGQISNNDFSKVLCPIQLATSLTECGEMFVKREFCKIGPEIGRAINYPAEDTKPAFAG